MSVAIITRGFGFSGKNLPTRAFGIVPSSISASIKKNTDNYMYVEQVTFRAPDGLTLVGGDDHRLSVFLKQKGLPGN